MGKTESQTPGRTGGQSICGQTAGVICLPGAWSRGYRGAHQKALCGDFRQGCPRPGEGHVGCHVWACSGLEAQSRHTATPHLATQAGGTASALTARKRAQPTSAGPGRAEGGAQQAQGKVHVHSLCPCPDRGQGPEVGSCTGLQAGASRPCGGREVELGVSRATAGSRSRPGTHRGGGLSIRGHSMEKWLCGHGSVALPL